jgi:hypothetical protein
VGISIKKTEDSMSTACCLAFLCLVNPLRLEDKPATEALAPLARFVGGEWVTHGKWSDGTELHARATYVWGVNRKVILGKTFVQDGKGGEYQRYEEIIFWQPKQQRIVHISVAFNGAVSENVCDAPEADMLRFGYTPVTPDQPPKVRQTIRFTDDNTFIWKAELQGKDGWQPLIEATWRRKTEK